MPRRHPSRSSESSPRFDLVRYYGGGLAASPSDPAPRPALGSVRVARQKEVGRGRHPSQRGSRSRPARALRLGRANRCQGSLEQGSAGGLRGRSPAPACGVPGPRPRTLRCRPSPSRERAASPVTAGPSVPRRPSPGPPEPTCRKSGLTPTGDSGPPSRCRRPGRRPAVRLASGRTRTLKKKMV